MGDVQAKTFRSVHFHSFVRPAPNGDSRSRFSELDEHLHITPNNSVFYE